MRWDDELTKNGDNRVSPWDVEPTGSVLLSTVLPATGPKKTKIYHAPDHLEPLIPSKFGIVKWNHIFGSKLFLF